MEIDRADGTRSRLEIEDGRGLIDDTRAPEHEIYNRKLRKRTAAAAVVAAQDMREE